MTWIVIVLGVTIGVLTGMAVSNMFSEQWEKMTERKYNGK